jgi:Transposase domain (DUF772)
MVSSQNHLLNLIEMAKEIYQEAKAEHIRRGHPYEFPDWAIFLAFTVMVLKRLKQFSALHTFLKNNPEVRRACGLKRLPHRTTFSRRLKRLAPTIKRQIRAWGKRLLAEGVGSAEMVATDKKMITAQGPKWHKADREADRIPEKLRNVDTDSSWSKSGYRGWVQGYGLHVEVTTPDGGPIIPLDGDFTNNTTSESAVARAFVPHMPEGVQRYLGDSGFDDPVLRDMLEQRDENGQWQRALLVPITIMDATQPPRLEYAQLYKEEKDLYAQRKVSIEPFFDRLDQAFGIKVAWMKGWRNNHPIGMLWLSTYQLCMLYNHRRGLPVEHIKQILDSL